MERNSLLFRRIVAIYPPRTKLALVRGVLAAGAVLALSASAWLTPAPARVHHDDKAAPIPPESETSDEAAAPVDDEATAPGETPGTEEPRETDAAAFADNSAAPRPRARPRRSRSSVAPLVIPGMRTLSRERYTVSDERV